MATVPHSKASRAQCDNPTRILTVGVEQRCVSRRYRSRHSKHYWCSQNGSTILFDGCANRVERKLQMGVKAHLDAWFAEAEKAAWKNPAELKQQFRSGSIVSAERVV